MTEAMLDISPRVHLLHSLRAGGPVDHVLLAGEAIDNALDAGARRISLTISENEIRVRDDGRGIDREHMPSLFTLGLHMDMPTSRLGRYGVGIKIQALRAGDGLEIRTVCAEGATVAKVNWRALLSSRQWKIPAPRWMPVVVGTPTMTEIVVSDLRDAPKATQEAFRLEIALRFHPALAEGAQISVNGVRVEPIPEPDMDDVIDERLSISDRSHVHIRAGLLTADSQLRLVHIGFEHRVLMPGVRFGCGTYSGVSKIFARVQLSGDWRLGQFKDQLTDEGERRVLEAVIEDTLRPLLEKCQAASMTAKLDKLVAEINDLLPENISARPHHKKQTKVPLPSAKRKNARGNYVAPDKGDEAASGPAKTKRRVPAKLLIEFDEGAGRYGIGTFDGSGRPHRVILSKDDPTIADLMTQRDRHQVALRSLYVAAMAIYVHGIEMERASGREREFPDLEGTFGQQISRLLSDQNLSAPPATVAATS